MEEIYDFIRRLRGQLKEAKPLDSEPTLQNPRRVAEYAAKRVGHYGYGSPELSERAECVETPEEAYKVLVECLASLPKLAEQPEPEPGDLLTFKEAARYLRMTEPGLRKLKDAKRIRCVQNGKGGRIKFLREDLETFLEENTNGPDDIERSPARIYRPAVEAQHGFS